MDRHIAPSAEKAMGPEGYVRVGVFGACAAGHHHGQKDKSCPQYVVDFKCTCECHTGKAAVPRKPAFTGWCQSGQHTECPVLRRDGDYVCSCPCHRSTAEPVNPPRLTLKKRKNRS